MRIQFKLLVFILLQLVLVFAALTVVTLQIGKQSIRDESRLGLSDDLVSFSQAAAAFRKDRKPGAMAAAVQKLMNDPQVVYFVLQDETKRILFSRSKAPNLNAFIERTEPPARQLKLLEIGVPANVDFYDFNNRSLTEMWQAVLVDGTLRGFVRIGVDEKAVNVALQRFSRSAVSRLLFLDLAIAVLAVLLTYFFVQRLSRPMELFQSKIHKTLNRFGPPSPGGSSELSLNEIADRFETAMQGIVLAQNERMDWVSTLSHEFRSPLQAIKGYAEYIRNGHTGPITPKTEHILSLIISGSSHFEDFINQILDLVRLETGKLRLETGPLHLAPVLEEAAHFYQMEAPKQGLQFVLEVEENLPVVQGDAASLHRIVTNLLSNAFKFTPPGGTIRLRASRREGGVVVAVADTGVGISPKDVGKVFDKFFQSAVDYRTPGQAKGLGIGLAVCKMLVEAQKGTIWVESEVGVGTSFLFTLNEEVHP